VPIYEYQCAKCGKIFEALQKFSDAPLKRHKECGGSVKRLVSQSSFQLKGGGWYASGYAKEPPKAEGSDGKAEAKADSASEAKPAETKSESKSESKSEVKAEGKASKSSEQSSGKPAKTKSKN